MAVYRTIRDALNRADVRQMFDDPVPVMEALRRLESRMNATVNENGNLLHARLVRVMPHLADIFTYLC
jgi:hypothetical protein